MAVLTWPQTGPRPSVTASRSDAAGVAKVVTSALALVAVAVVCVSLHLYGCMKLDAVSQKKASMQSALVKLERANVRLTNKRDDLVHPHRLAEIAEESSMKRVANAIVVACPPQARMAKAADTLPR